jgi:hypothetical protein
VLEGHVAELLAMDAADRRLVGVEIRRPQPFAAHPATRDDQEIAGRRIGLDLLGFVKLAGQRRVPEVGDRLLLGQPQRVVLATLEKWPGLVGELEAQVVALAPGEQDLRDIVE